ERVVATVGVDRGRRIRGRPRNIDGVRPLTGVEVHERDQAVFDNPRASALDGRIDRADGGLIVDGVGELGGNAAALDVEVVHAALRVDGDGPHEAVEGTGTVENVDDVVAQAGLDVKGRGGGGPRNLEVVAAAAAADGDPLDVAEGEGVGGVG